MLKWGSKIYFRDEKRFIQIFGFGFNLWIKHDSAAYTAERFISSWCKSSPHFIISSQQKRQGYLDLFEPIQVVLDVSYVQPYRCSKTNNCLYESRDKWKISRHEKNCTNETTVKYKQKCFGNHGTARTELINNGTINNNDDTHRRFVSFDIESINCTETAHSFGHSYLYGTQKVISIGYCASFGDYKNVIVRDDMTKASGLKLVKTFLAKMQELQLRHYERIPSAIKEAMYNYKELLKNKNLAVAEQTTLGRRLCYLRSLCCLKVIGFNSSGYDLPCLLSMMVEVMGPSKVKVIKKGNSVFDLNIDKLSFRDCMNYCGPMSLAKFAKIFKLPISKGIFPYEYFRSIGEMREQISWPEYTAFRSSLPTKTINFTSEIGNILQEKSKYNMKTLKDVFHVFKFDCSTFPSEILNMEYLPELCPTQMELIQNHFTLSPLNYINQKLSYESACDSGEYTNFADYLITYNLLDCELLTQAMSKFIDVFDRCFNVSILDKLSLPGIAEEIMWTFYDESSPKMFSFNEKHGFINKRIREKLQGGPTIVFHRHAEIKQTGSFHESVYTVPNGDKYNRLVSYDFNALYAYAMKQDLPTGLPFYYRKKADATFKFEIAGSMSGWSSDAMDWINRMSYDPRFLKPDGTFYDMKSAITSEYTIKTRQGTFTVDGMVKTPSMTYFLEFFGCR